MALPNVICFRFSLCFLRKSEQTSLTHSTQTGTNFTPSIMKLQMTDHWRSLDWIKKTYSNVSCASSAWENVTEEKNGVLRWNSAPFFNVYLLLPFLNFLFCFNIHVDLLVIDRSRASQLPVPLIEEKITSSGTTKAFIRTGGGLSMPSMRPQWFHRLTTCLWTMEKILWIRRLEHVRNTSKDGGVRWNKDEAHMRYEPRKLSAYMDEFLWRQLRGKILQEAFDNVLIDIWEWYSVP